MAVLQIRRLHLVVRQILRPVAMRMLAHLAVALMVVLRMLHRVGAELARMVVPLAAHQAHARQVADFRAPQPAPVVPWVGTVQVQRVRN